MQPSFNTPGQPKRIEITITADGSTKIEAFNFHGVGCKDATKQLEMVLAGPGGHTDTKPKPDFYQSITPSQGLTR